MRPFVISILLYLLSFNLFADNKDSLKIFPEFKFHYGFILRHHENMNLITSIHFSAFELNIARQTNGSKEWQQAYAYPQLGISFWYSALNNSNYLGNAYTFNPYINFPVVRRIFLRTNEVHFRLYYRFGVGIGWLSKTFNTYDNYKNIAIGSHLNATVRMNIEAGWTFKRLIINTGIGLTHLSNGNFKKPNLGINLVTANCGIAYKFGSSPKANFIKKELMPAEKKTSLLLTGTLGIKAIYPTGSTNFPVYDLGLTWLRKVSRKSEFGAGTELFYDISDFASIKNKGGIINSDLQIIKPALYLAYSLDISRLSINLNFGGYLYAKFKLDGYVYDRLALRYNISDKLFLNLSLKTYYAKADITEYGIGYRIK